MWGIAVSTTTTIHQALRRRGFPFGRERLVQSWITKLGVDPCRVKEKGVQYTAITVGFSGSKLLTCRVAYERIGDVP